MSKSYLITNRKKRITFLSMESDHRIHKGIDLKPISATIISDCITVSLYLPDVISIPYWSSFDATHRHTIYSIGQKFVGHCLDFAVSFKNIKVMWLFSNLIY